MFGGKSIKSILLFLCLGVVIGVYLVTVVFLDKNVELMEDTPTYYEEEKLFTGLAVKTFTEFRVDDEIAFPVKVDGKDFNWDGKKVGFQLVFLVMACSLKYDRCGESYGKDGLIIANLKTMLDLFCEGRKEYKSCEFEDESLNEIELYLPGPTFVRRIKDEAWYNIFSKDKFEKTRFPFTRGGAGTLSKLINANINPNTKVQKPRGLCVKRYQLGLGYDNLTKFTKSKNVDKDLTLLTANVLDTRIYAAEGKTTKGEVIKACDYFDNVASYQNDNKKRKSFILSTLDKREIEYHREHAKKFHNEITQYTGGTALAKNNMLDYIIKPVNARSQRAGEATNSGAYLGALRVTVSSTYGLIDKNFFENNGIYLRKDITHAYFGSYIDNVVLKGRESWLDKIIGNGAVRNVYLSEPELIAKDRYIKEMYMSKNFVFNNSGAVKSVFDLFSQAFLDNNAAFESTNVDSKVNEGIDEVLKKNEAYIKSLAKRSTRKILHRYYSNKDKKESMKRVIRFKFN